MQRRNRRPLECVCAALLVGLALACASTSTSTPTSDEPKGSKLGFDAGLPGTRTTMGVTAVRERGPYLEADLTLGDKPVQAYVLPSAECRLVFVAGESVAYADTGPQGVYHHGESRCQSMGFGNLLVWRDRNSRASTGEAVPRSQANFRVIDQDADGTMIRGNLPQAARLGFTNTVDLVAVVGRSPDCDAATKDGVASIEYRGKGKRVLSLVGPHGLCDIQALAIPPPTDRESAGDEAAKNAGSPSKTSA